jgi:hypothetical protein
MSGCDAEPTIAQEEPAHQLEGLRRRFVDVEITWRGKPFTRARGQDKADVFETEGVIVRARKPSD